MTPLRVTVPKGSIFNPEYPSPTYASPPTTAVLLAGAIARVVAEISLAAGLKDTVCAPWNTTQGGCFQGGRNQLGHLEGTVLFDANGGGTGATLTTDGDDTSAFILAPGSRMADVESYEMKYPLLYLFRRKRQNSGGYGQFQGGLGGEAAVMVHGSKRWQVGFRSLGQKVTSTTGILGAYPANSNPLGFIFRSATSGSKLTAIELNHLLSVDALLKRPDAKIVPPMCPPVALSEGDIYVQCWAGGGGCGDPLQRDPRMVLDDFVIGKISPAVAHEIYGVVLKGEEIDDNATQDLRANIRNRRKANCTFAPERSEKEVEGNDLERLVPPSRKIGCFVCGFVLEGPLPSTDRKPRDVMHFWIDDDWMFYREYYCPRCWSLIRVDAMSPKDESYSFF